MPHDIDDAIRQLNAGRLEEAMAAARALASAPPADGRALAVWGVAALELGRHAEAIGPLKAAASQARDVASYVGVMVPLARALQGAGLWAEAEKAVSAAERAGTQSPDDRDRLGGVLFRIGLHERALPHFRAAAQAVPDRAEFQRDLGMGLIALGRLDEAEAALERAISLDADFGIAHMTLADLRTWTPDTSHLDRLSALWGSQALPAGDRPAVGFALFKELDDLGRRDEAWPVLEEANRLEAADQPPWSRDAERELVEALIDAFPAERFRGLGRAAPISGPGPRPVFIVGLPRSGTTLVERILAAHTGVVAMGELVAFPLLFKQASAAAGGELLDARTARAGAGIDWPGLARAYRAETAYLWRGGEHVIDKQPRNSAYVGAIRLAFPDALIIHLRRDPMDGLLGAYKVSFASGHAWSRRLQDLADHYHLHRRLMAHWRACLGEGLIELDYEALAADPEPQIRRLLDACGLAFEEACLSPERAAGSVATASSAQVRSPISGKRIGAWKRYATQLEPLRSRLQAQGDLEPGDV